MNVFIDYILYDGYDVIFGLLKRIVFLTFLRFSTIESARTQTTRFPSTHFKSSNPKFVITSRSSLISTKKKNTCFSYEWHIMPSYKRARAAINSLCDTSRPT